MRVRAAVETTPTRITGVEDTVVFAPQLSAADRSDPALTLTMHVEVSEDDGATWQPLAHCTFQGGAMAGGAAPAFELGVRNRAGKVFVSEEEGTRFVDLDGQMVRLRLTANRTVDCGARVRTIDTGTPRDDHPLRGPRSIAAAQTKATVIGTGVTSLGVSFAATPTVGNHCVAFCDVHHTALSPPAISCSDNQSNSYSEAVTNVQARVRAEFNTAPIATASGTFTVTIDSGGTSTNMDLGLAEVSGQDTTTPVEASNSGIGSSTSPSSGAVAPAGNALYCAICVAQTVSQAITEEAAGWTLHTENEGGAGVHSEIYQIGSGSKTANWTLATGGNWAAAIVALKEAAAAGGHPTTRRLGKTRFGRPVEIGRQGTRVI